MNSVSLYFLCVLCGEELSRREFYLDTLGL
jgi:hypothetical protein